MSQHKCVGLALFGASILHDVAGAEFCNAANARFDQFQLARGRNQPLMKKSF
jgi:hypothetical protein